MGKETAISPEAYARWPESELGEGRIGHVFVALFILTIMGYSGL